MLRNSLLLAVFAVCLCSCVRTRTETVATVTGPSIQATSVLVAVGSGDAILDQVGEAEAEKRLTAAGYRVERFTVWLAQRLTGDKAVYANALREHHIDAIVYFIATESGEKTERIPEDYVPGQSTSYVAGYGNTATVNTVTMPGYTTGGGTISMPWARFKAQIEDAKTRKISYVAGIKSRGNAYAEQEDLMRASVNDLLDESQKAGFLNPLNRL